MLQTSTQWCNISSRVFCIDNVKCVHEYSHTFIRLQLRLVFEGTFISCFDEKKGERESFIHLNSLFTIHKHWDLGYFTNNGATVVWTDLILWHQVWSSLFKHLSNNHKSSASTEEWSQVLCAIAFFIYRRMYLFGSRCHMWICTVFFRMKAHIILSTAETFHFVNSNETFLDFCTKNINIYENWCSICKSLYCLYLI